MKRDERRLSEAAHVRADLGDEGRSRDRSGRGPGQQELHRFFLLGNQGSNLHLHPMDGPIQVVEVVKQFANEQSVMSLDPPIQSQTQRRPLFAQSSFGQLGQDLRVRLSIFDGPEHASPTDPDHVTGYCPQFDIGRFQHLVDTIDLLSTQFDQRFAVARQIAQDSD